MTNSGLRERKRVRTREALAEAAWTLFLKHGYDGVTVAQIADAADVSLATLFKHVPDGKEALIFDDGCPRWEALVAAVGERDSGTDVLTALQLSLAGLAPFTGSSSAASRRRRTLILSTPALRGYQRRLWMDGEADLAAALAAASDGAADDPALRALARYILEIPDLVSTDAQPTNSLEAIFALLRAGWPAA